MSTSHSDEKSPAQADPSKHNIGKRKRYTKDQKRLLLVMLLVLVCVILIPIATIYQILILKIVVVPLTVMLLLGLAWIIYVPWMTHARAVRKLRGNSVGYWEIVRRVFEPSAEAYNPNSKPNPRHDEDEQSESANVRKPEEWPGVAILDRAQKKIHREAGAAKWDYQGKAIPLAVLATLSAFFLAWQNSLTPWDAGWGLGLAMTAAMMQLALVVFGLWYKHPTSPWLEKRMASEILRREQYLCVAEVGPYARISDKNSGSPADDPKKKEDGETKQQMERIARQRVDEIEAQSMEVLSERYVPLHDANGAWIEQAWRSKSVMSDVDLRINTYRIHRVRDQIFWYKRDCQALSRKSQAYLLPLIAIMVVSFALSVAHCVVLAVELFPAASSATPSTTKNPVAQAPAQLASAPSAQTPAPTRTIEAFIGVIAILAPLITGMLLAMRSLFAFAPQAAIYRKTISRLREIDRECDHLLHHDRAQNDDQLRTRRFQSLVLRTEAILTSEMEEWVSTVDHREFEIV